MGAGKRISVLDLPRMLTTVLLTFALVGRLTHAINVFGSGASEDDDERTNERENDDDDSYDEDDEFYDEDEDEFHDEDDDEEYEEVWKDPLNVTTEESYVLSGIADYMSDVHTLLWNNDIRKDTREAEKDLEETWMSVKRDALTVSAAVALLPGDKDTVLRCVATAQKEAQQELQLLQKTLLDCFKEEEKFPPSNTSLDDGEDDADDEAVSRDAADFLVFALEVMSATRLEGALETVKLAKEHPHGLPALVQHAEMLQRRGLRRRAVIRQCVGVNKAETYKKADEAREAVAQCLLMLAVPPQGVDLKEEL